MFQRTVLKQGLRLITVPNRSTQTATVLILVPVGSRYERKNINGISHFVEHMMFKGTQRRPTTQDISRELDSIGAEYNAFTSKDYTGYYIKSSAEKVELSFDILSDMLFHSRFDPKELDRERGVIIEEIHMYEDNPLMYVESLFERLVFGNHPLGWDIAGTRENISHITRRQMVHYVQKYYALSHLIVTVAGNIRKADIQKLVQKYFSLSANTVNKKKHHFLPFRGRQGSPRILLKEKKTEQVQLCLGFPALSHYAQDLPALQLLGLILGGNMSSRLFINIRERQGLCYFIKAVTESYADTGVFVVQAGLDRNRIQEAIRLIIHELALVREKGVTEQELQSAKEFLRGKLVLHLEDSENMADFFAKQELFHKKLQTPQEKLKKYLRVTTQQIQAVARKIIVPQRVNLALIGPYRMRDRAMFRRLLEKEHWK